jgi:hypothetical protein
MSQNLNPGFSPEEIQQLKDLCVSENRSFTYVEDEDFPEMDLKEMVHVQFVGQFNQQEVIYDAIISTLQLHYSSQLYEAAEKEVMEQFPKYVPLENRDENYQSDPELDEEVEMIILEIIEELEENEEIKVAEFIELDENFEFGISLEAALMVPSLEEDIIHTFINDFNSGKLSLDPSLYSFNSEDDEDEDDE